MSSLTSDPPARENSEFLQNHIEDSFSCYQTTKNESFQQVRSQMLPFVYIQTPTKSPFTTTSTTTITSTTTTISNNNSSDLTNNSLINTVPQLQFTTIPTTCLNQKKSTIVPSNQGVILTPVKTDGKSQQLLIHKSGVPIVPVTTTTKLTGTYLTMLKPVGKIDENNCKILENNTTINNNSNNNNNNSNNGTTNQKILLAPLPKNLKNRLSVTVTTNTNIQPKFTFMPLSIPPQQQSDEKVFNLKINGELENNENKQTQFETITKTTTPTTKMTINTDEIVDLSQCSTKSDDDNIEQSVIDNVDYKEQEQLLQQQQQIVINRDINKDNVRFSKHGISILKKSFNSERIRNLTKLTKDIDEQQQQQQQPVPTQKQQKSERRRKSNFAYRKDYDDMEIIGESKSEQITEIFDYKQDLNKLNHDDNNFNNNNNNNNNNNADVIKKQSADKNLKKYLKWNNGIGSLPGSNIKFIINEFNLIEYLTDDEYNKYIEQKLNKTKLVQQQQQHNEIQEDLRCIECGCYGLPSEFITSKYCSLDCQEVGNNKLIRARDLKLKQRKRKKTYQLKKINQQQQQKLEQEQQQIQIKDENLSGNSDDEIISNDNSQDKFTTTSTSYPWTCSKKGFSWTKYLEHVKAKAAPTKLFKDPFPYDRNNFRIGMKLEGIDPYHPSYFCVLTISEICGYRLRLHFDGYPDNYDFWINADSIDIFPIGWCEKHGHVLQPPPGYTVDNFNWINYLKQTKSISAPKHLFANRTGNTICPNGFRIGMKLEAVDRKNSSLVCVATVRDMMDNRILVHFDSWDDIYDYWADPTSPYIHPVGWCDQMGHSLTPPNDYPNPETFSWSKYLKETKSVAVPARAFKQRPSNGFKRGMRLECVDKRVPQLIRVATVDQVKNHQIRIHFDGWPDRYSYWIDDNSDDIHPVGWCHKTGHPLEPPLTPDDVYDFLECPTVGCRGIGHIHGAKYATHSEQQYCPYAEDNIDSERVLPDRLLTPDRLVEAVVPVSCIPKDKIKTKKPSKFRRTNSTNSITTSAVTTTATTKIDENFFVKKSRRKYRKRIKVDENLDIDEDGDGGGGDDDDDDNDDCKIKANQLIELSKIEPAQKEAWQKHSQFLHTYVKNCDDVRDWLVDRVIEFINNIPDCKFDVEQFKIMKIDGEAFLSLSQKDLLDLLHMKMGPAVKLYNIIVLLRQKVSQSLFH